VRDTVFQNLNSRQLDSPQLHLQDMAAVERRCYLFHGYAFQIPRCQPMQRRLISPLPCTHASITAAVLTVRSLSCLT